MAKKQDKEPERKANGDGPRNGDGKPHGSEASPLTAGGAVTQAQLNVIGQYVRDISFESPNAPQTLQGPGENPQLQVSVNVNAQTLAEETYEVALNVEVHAKNDAGVIYNVELVYAGLFRLRNIPQNLLQRVLFVDCPAILFPFLRRVLSDIVRDGGFPPLMLDPIDFGKLYAQNLARAQAQPETKN